MYDYVDSMRGSGRILGQQASASSEKDVEFAEAYRQHRGHGYPHDQILSELLQKCIVSARGMESESTTPGSLYQPRNSKI